MGSLIVRMSRAFRIALLLIETLWFSVLVPGHTRGQIALPGAPAKTCCEKPNHAMPVKSCAMCYFIATLDVPPPIVFVTPPALIRDDDRSPTLLSAIVNPLPRRPDLARAPPACFA